MYTHETQIRVRYSETDQMGYAYYGNYAQYYEVGRVEMIRSLDLTYKSLEEEHGILMPVVSLDMRFVRPAHYDELLTIKTTLAKLPVEYIVFQVEVYNEAGKLVNSGRIRLCFVDVKSNQRVSTPKLLVDKLSPFFAV